MNDSYFRSLAIQALSAPPWPDGRFPPSPYYRFFRLLAQDVKPKLSVELGLCGGGGSFHLAEGHPFGIVVGVEHSDGEPQQQENWKYIQQRHKNFVLWKGDSVKSAPEIAKVYGAVDLLFVDTCHTFAQTMAEWNAWEPYMAPGGIVMLDDLFRPGMEDAWNNIPWPNKLRLDALHTGAENGGGFGVVWR